MLDVTALECVRGERTLFRDMGFKVEPGMLVHVAGANGAGKTSLLRIVCGLSMPEAGEVRWHGEPLRAVREEYWRHLTYVAHSNALKDDLTALENLRFASGLAGIEATAASARASLERFGVARCADLPARVLSQGQRRRVSLARLGVPDRAGLWVLDEPFSALDVDAVEHLRGLIEAHLARGGAVIFTTHQPVDIAAVSRLTVRLDA